MSFDVHLEVDAGGPEPVQLEGLDRNYTSNCASMWLLDGDPKDPGLRGLDGLDGADAEDILRLVVADIDANIDRYRQLEPANGWGDVEGWRAFLVAIADACEKAPRAILVVS